MILHCFAAFYSCFVTMVAIKGLAAVSFKDGGGSGLSLWKKLFRVINWRGRPGHVLTF